MVKIEWRIRAKMPEYKLNVSSSMEIIHRAMDKAKVWAVNWSAGKDSTAMTHMIKSLYPNTPIVIQFDDCDWPEKRPYYERICKCFGWDCTEVEPDFSVWDRAREHRIGFEDLCSTRHSLTKEGFIKPLQDARKQLGCDGSFLGLRADESYHRKVHLATRSPLYQLKSGEWRCCPLARWNVEDVFAYHVENDIEINPCYFHNRFFPPEKIRLAWALPTPRSLTEGGMQQMRYYYTDQYRRLREMGVE